MLRRRLWRKIKAEPVLISEQFHTLGNETKGRQLGNQTGIRAVKNKRKKLCAIQLPLRF